MLVTIQKKIEGDGHPVTATLYTKIAGNYRLSKNFEQAIMFSVKAYDIIKKTYGKSND